MEHNHFATETLEKLAVSLSVIFGDIKQEIKINPCKEGYEITLPLCTPAVYTERELLNWTTSHKDVIAFFRHERNQTMGYQSP